MSYLKTYGRRRLFQEGGEMAPAGPEAGMEGAPAPDAGMDQEAQGAADQVLQLAEATVGGDMQAAQELGVMMAPMILEQVQAAGQGQGQEAMGEAPPEGAEPVFGKGGTFIGKV